MALTTSGSVEPHPNPRADADAAAVYSGNDATRMHREAGIADVARTHTTGSAGESAIGRAFLDGDHQWTKTAGKAAGGNAAGVAVPGTPGFPGDTNWPPG